MNRLCDCGQQMELDLRTVIYSHRIKIERVPVFACESCSHFEVLPLIKENLLSLIAELNIVSGIHKVLFTEICDIADIIDDVFRHQTDDIGSPIEQLLNDKIEERINLLLDLYRYAQELGDTDWMEDVSNRLGQITEHLQHFQTMDRNVG
ncbi:hypothetical protein PASE110613_02535 [Paenibacillus sediminis]|uniref:YgiT-type zinc finger protein n=1 Tax=Paenibacillus sediminis TaxID=664909 RepID=A0ABS4GZ45_9BACL|nr:hypothetical protein [Paenibacillus sediminis]MBP1935534.1 hypothetical protein [Paenibacillus sediminis]